jgi:hypothetical protein
MHYNFISTAWLGRRVREGEARRGNSKLERSSKIGLSLGFLIETVAGPTDSEIPSSMFDCSREHDNHTYPDLLVTCELTDHQTQETGRFVNTTVRPLSIYMNALKFRSSLISRLLV